MVSVPRAVLLPVGFTIGNVIAFAFTGGRIGAAAVALGVIWTMRTLRRSRSDGA